MSGEQKVAELQAAMVEIIKLQPCHDGSGGLFFPHFDGEGNEVGVEHIDPLSVIGRMVDVAHRALARTDGPS